MRILKNVIKTKMIKTSKSLQLKLAMIISKKTMIKQQLMNISVL